MREQQQVYYRSRPPLPPNFLPQHPFHNGHMTGRDEELGPWPRTIPVISDQLAEYYGMITHLDDQVGRILAALERTGNAQVSMNIEDWQASPPHQIVSAIESLAAERGVGVLGSELVGLMPVGAALAGAAEALRLSELPTESLLELRLLEEAVVSAETSTPAGSDRTDPPAR